MARAGKYTSIPKKGKSDPQIDAIAANLELITGQKGQGGKRAVLVEDLQNLGFATFKSGLLRPTPGFGVGDGGGGGVTPPTPPTIQPPTAPTGFAASGGFQYISFAWDNPAYVGHAYAEVWTSETDDFTSAVRIGITPATVFGYAVFAGWKGYSWVRFVNQLGVIGSLNNSAGTYVDTVTDPDYILDQLVDGIGEVHLDYDLDSQMEHLYDYQEWIEHNKAEGLLEEAITQDTFSIERRAGEKLLRATIETEYYTGVDVDKAIATATTTLRAEIEDPNGSSVGAELSNNYYTSVKTDEAIAAATTTLRSELDDLSADIALNYYTKVQSDEAIASATTMLKSQIEDPDGTSIGADLVNNYYTGVDTENAIATATTSLKAEMEDPNGTSLGASLDTLSQTVVDIDGYQQALWGVKAQAGDVTASIGLVAKSDPNNPEIDNAYFIVKDADFRVLYSKNPGDPDDEEVAPIFGTIDNPDYDSTDPDSPKKILVIDTASIKVANIRDLTVGSLVADSIVANSTITSPIVVGGEIRGSELNIGAGGPWNGYNFHVTSNGYAYLKGHIEADSGTFRGQLNVTSGGSSRLEITQDRISVYQSGTLRVRIGRL